MKWNYIGAFYQNSKYGIVAITDAKIIVRKRNICLSDIIRIESTDVKSYRRMLLNNYLLNNKKIEVIVLFLEEETLLKFMHGVSLIPRELWSHVSFISGSIWGTKQNRNRGRFWIWILKHISTTFGLKKVQVAFRLQKWTSRRNGKHNARFDKRAILRQIRRPGTLLRRHHNQFC